MWGGQLGGCEIVGVIKKCSCEVRSWNIIWSMFLERAIFLRIFENEFCTLNSL